MARHGHHDPHDPSPAHDRFGNPADLAAYLERLEGADRAEWQQPDEVVRALALKPGQTVAEIGAGPGYFTLRLARAVGPEGLVYAVEVEPRILPILRDRIEATKIRHAVPVLGLVDDPLVPPHSCDLILVVDTFHHFSEPAAYLRRLARSLKPGGRIVNLDFHKRELPVGPPLDHLVSRDEFLRHAEEAGLRVVKEHRFLEHQYFVELAPRN